MEERSEHSVPNASKNAEAEPGTYVNDEALGLSSVKEIYCCPYSSCNFSTAWKSSLNMHMKTHTDERPWQCALCNKHFKLKHHLKHHILTHSQHKLLKCNLCDYRCNDSHSLQRHKVNRHRFPQKRSFKKHSLPTMVNLPSVEAYAGNNAFFNNLLEQKRTLTSETDDGSSFSQISGALSTIAAAPTVPLDGNLSAFGKMIIEQQKLNAISSPKKRSIRSVSDSFTTLFGHRISSSENESLIDLSDDMDKYASKNSSDSPAESIPVTVKEENTQDRDSPSSLSLQKTPNSQTSYEYLHGNRTLLDLTPSKSPTLRETRFSSSSRDRIQSPIFEDRLKSPVSSRTIESEDADKSQSDKKSTPDWECAHCSIIFPDNIMYGLHMGCHSVGSPFQCNICGMKCKDSHDFMFHFTIGKHLV